MFFENFLKFVNMPTLTEIVVLNNSHVDHLPHVSTGAAASRETLETMMPTGNNDELADGPQEKEREETGKNAGSTCRPIWK